MKPSNLLHALILALAASAFLALAVFAGHAAITTPALAPWLLAIFMACASIHLYAETFRALND